MQNLKEKITEVCSEEEVKKLEKLLNDNEFEFSHFWVQEITQGFYKVICQKKPYYSQEVLPLGDFEMTLLIIKHMIMRATYANKKLEDGYLSYFYTLGKASLINSFLSLESQIPDDEYFEVFKYVYQNSEYNFEVFDTDILEKAKELNPEKYDDQMKIQVYRGVCSKSTYKGISWTTDYEVARKFALRFEDNGIIIKTEMSGIDIVLIDSEGREKEVIIIPEYVSDDDFIEEYVSK